MEQRLVQRLEHKLIITPTLQQSIKMLQLSKLELIEQIRQEVTENPVLEEVAEESPLAQPQEVPTSSQEPAPTTAPEEVPAAADSPYPVELDWDAFSRYDGPDGPPPEEDGKDDFWYENVLSTRESLQDHLLWQLHLTVDGEEEVVAGEEIVGDIDDDGYLRASVEEVAERAGVAPETVARVLEVVQAFDPPGVGARTVEECLALQLRQLPEPVPLAEEIVRHHLRKLENKNFTGLAQALRRPPEEVAAAAEVIAGLEPKPGRLYTPAEPQYVIPDLYIHKDGDDYRVTLNDEGLPRLRLSSRYRRMLRDPGLAAETREYIQKKFSAALWLVKSIDQRQKTIFRVAQSIVRQQRDFLDRGINHLRPMVLRDVADDIGVHESTVSRVTTRKYAQTPQGLFELKFFFNAGIDKDAGDAVASASVQNIIRLLVAEEDPGRPLSDQEIAARLRRERGLIIARRTVAKYRGLLRILPAGKRRRIVARSTKEDAQPCT